MTTQRERYLDVMLYGGRCKIPFAPGKPRISTLSVWHSEGLPEDVCYEKFLAQELGIDPEALPGLVDLRLNHRMVPEFEEKVLERKEHTLIVQDWKGNICEISDQYDVSYLRAPVDFVTRRWIKCPVETRDDWERMKERYDIASPGRYPDGFLETCREYAERTFPLKLRITGVFGQLREWLGFEALCLLFYDDPGLLADMIGFWNAFVSGLLEETFKHVVPDVLIFTEDMAYKMHVMVSPDMTRRYLSPAWRNWTQIAIDAGVPVRCIDSDGYVHDLLPIWMENGINLCEPVEIAAGNDLHEMRRICGRRMAFYGGVDKRAIAAGGAVIEEEMAKLRPVIRDGGFVPSCDHDGVPPDVTWANFVKYSRILARQTGWLD